ncbi:hypothetical protein MMC22_007936 [Lobaria immixta]|nr:hypothetical protein [Lobaria immixta]
MSLTPKHGHSIEATVCAKKKKGRGRPCKNTSANVSALLEQAPVSKIFKARDETKDQDRLEGLITKPIGRKTAQEMESTKHNKATESAKEKKLREYTDKSRRHARECAQALRKDDPLPSLFSSFAPSPSPRQQARYCICEQCHIPKAMGCFLPAGVNDEFKNCCMHCLTESNGASDEMRWCYFCSHEVARPLFFFNNQEYSDCNRCAKHRHNATPSSHAIENLDDQAIPADHWKLIEKFNSELDKLERLPCDVCNEIDFDMGIKETNGLNECKRC